MKPVEDHLHQVLVLAQPLAARDAPTDAALGCVLAADLAGELPLPGFDNSAMDGYAVRSAEVAGASPANPVTLPVTADIPAGDTRAHVLAPGTVMRIMTGAPIPEGADAIVPVELTDGGTAAVQVRGAVSPGQHRRRAGEDVQAGQLVLTAGTRLGPRQLALAFSVGAVTVSVYPTPRVAVLSTGDELVQAGTRPGFGQVIDSNGPMLVQALRESGFHAEPVIGVGDTVADVRRVLDGLLTVGADDDRGVDAVVTTGGVSMGAYDAVKEALSALGTVEFTQVAMQPGKPQGAGYLRAPDGRAVPVFTLPGNPVSALVSLEVFVKPALRVMAGRPPFEVPAQAATAAHDFGSPPDKTQFARVYVDRPDRARGVGGPPPAADRRPAQPWREPLADPPAVRLAGVGQGSHMMGGLAEADALAVIPAATTQVRAGDLLTCLPLPGGWWG